MNPWSHYRWGALMRMNHYVKWKQRVADDIKLMKLNNMHKRMKRNYSMLCLPEFKLEVKNVKR
jgi:hypothetical protein